MSFELLSTCAWFDIKEDWKKKTRCKIVFDGITQNNQLE
jgi:hypothetical protein